MTGIDNSTLDKWRGGKAHEQVAVYIWEKHIKGRKQGTEMPTLKHLVWVTKRSIPVIGKAKRLLAEYGVLVKEDRRWVVA
jgi:hypothetical protein